MNTRHLPRRQVGLTIGILVIATSLGLAGTDLVLPAVPRLPDRLGGRVEDAQYVLAAYVAGAGIVLMLFGALGARFSQTRLLVLSLLSLGVRRWPLRRLTR